ncbi:hypothetical protein SAMN06265173_1316 [Thalassovita litoralis]|uniref:Uncharacterized protein n=1 Tax=Thalassovita litoralis TaxID=1010611 RepID=A0A521FIE0_9RHOB|nr:hypothetical protein [Thalassovita litoralis]SMO95982.1 hypothetical protein SAMN06265173_1316 [Thalassovita litoralis]
MSLHSHFDRRAVFPASLKGKSPEARVDAFANEVLETGGVWTTPPGDYDPDSRALFEIHLHGITATGWTKSSAISTWVTMAHVKAASACPRCGGRGVIHWHPHWDNGHEPCPDCIGSNQKAAG